MMVVLFPGNIEVPRRSTRPYPRYDRKIDDKDDWAQGARMPIAGRGYKAGRLTYIGNAALSPPSDTDTDTSPGRRGVVMAGSRR
jgi:hypothetical protein